MTTATASANFHAKYIPAPRPVSTVGVTLSATPTQVASAAGIALACVAFHDARGRRADQDLGTRNLAINHVGSLAEHLVRTALDEQGIPYAAAPFFSLDVPTVPDLTIGGRSFNVKAIPFAQSYLMVNEGQRLDPKKAADFILPVRFTSATTAILLAPIPAADLAQWKLMQGHSPYRSIAVSRLAPMDLLHQLAKIAEVMPHA